MAQTDPLLTADECNALIALYPEDSSGSRFTLGVIFHDAK